MADELREWDQQPGEKTLWYDRFWKWLHDPRRSMMAVYNGERDKARKGKAESPPGAWKKAARQWKWAGRAQAWDDYEHERLDEEWEAQRKQRREVEWSTALALIERVNQMLVFPLASTTLEQEAEEPGSKVRNVMTVNPARWNFRDAALIAETASKLARLATGQATESVAIDWRTTAAEAGLDPDDPMFHEIVKKILDRMDAEKNRAASVAHVPTP
jgi:hypothetical protein